MPLSRKILVPEQHPLQSWTGAKSRGGVGKGNASWTLKLAICADLTRASCEILKELCCLIVTGRLQPELRQHGLHGRKDHRGPFFVSCLQLAFLNRSTRSWSCLNSSAAASPPCDYEALRASGRVVLKRRGPGLGTPRQHRPTPVGRGWSSLRSGEPSDIANRRMSACCCCCCCCCQRAKGQNHRKKGKNQKAKKGENSTQRKRTDQKPKQHIEIFGLRFVFEVFGAFELSCSKVWS